MGAIRRLRWQNGWSAKSPLPEALRLRSVEPVTTLEGARRIVQAGIDAFGAVDGAVCCAGILRHRPFVEMSEDDFSLVVDTHLKGHFNVFRALAEHVVARAGTASMVAISSGYVSGDPVRANYRAAKAGIVGP